MCERSLEEVIARELAIASWVGNRRAVLGKDYAQTMEQYTEENFEDYKAWAKDIIRMTETHEKEES